MDNIKEEKKTDEELIEEVKKEAEAKKLAEARKLEEDRKIEEDKKAKNQVPIRNVFSKELQADKYFYKGIVPPGFEGTCGKPVDREELIEVFHKVFKPKDNILFYKQTDKEVYIIIIPIKFSTSIGDFNDSVDGDFQKHAISFLSEGSVNLDTLRQKLERINKFVNYTDR